MHVNHRRGETRRTTWRREVGWRGYVHIEKGKRGTDRPRKRIAGRVYRRACSRALWREDPVPRWRRVWW